MKNGTGRFNYFLDQLQELLDKASKQKNPGLWLYRNNARTPLFMLEGLSKLYAALHNKKRFSKLKERFKILEDIIGAVDYYDAFAKEFSSNKNIPASVIAYLQAQSREKVQSLNEALKENGWIGNGRMKKIRKRLDEIDWEEDKDEIKGIRKFYTRSVDDIVEFTAKSDFHFTNVEADVHELRRKLRWLSIYPQALRGCVQLSNSIKKLPVGLQKYQTPDIVNSPFNKMPDAGDNRYFLLLEQNYFFALSWIIAELGKLKDNGLRLIAIKEALQQAGSVSDADALSKAREYLGGQPMSLDEVLEAADKIARDYFQEQNLQKLIIGIGNTAS